MDQPVKLLIVPRKTTRRELVPRIRRHFEERFNRDEKLADVCVYNDKCYVKVQKPVVEFAENGRLQYHDIEFNLRYEIVRGAGGVVMEG